MSVVNGISTKYGPGRVDIQIEQGSDFVLPATLQTTVSNVLVPWDLSAATIEAHLSVNATTGETCVPLVITPVDLVNGKIQISLTSATTIAAPFDSLSPPPQTTTSPDVVIVGGWVLNITDTGIKSRVLEGSVYLDRDPCQE